MADTSPKSPLTDVFRSVAAAASRKTYGELRVAAYEATGMKVGHNSFADLAMESNRKKDDCLLSSIIVRAATGTPGDSFLPYARSQGFEGSVPQFSGRCSAAFSGLEA
jgi:hypothetical protein